MQVAVCLEMLYPELSFAERLKAARADGATQFEMWDWRDKDLDVLRRVMDEQGIALANMSGNRQHGLMDPAERAGLLAELVETGQVARRLGCRRLMLLSQALLPGGAGRPLPPGLSREQAFEAAVEAGRAAAREAERLDLELTIEPLNDRIDHPGYLLTSSRDAFELVRRIDHRRVKVLYDAYHLGVMGEDIAAEVADHLALVGHLHVADHPGRHEPGSGGLDYTRLFSVLRSKGYQGVVGGEFSPREDSSAAVQALLRC